MGDGRTGALTASELATLVAITGRLIPSDESGAGAIEAHAAYYIDLALGDALAPQRGLYSTGLAAIDAYARLQYGAAFVALPPTAQDGVLQVVERGLPSESMEASRCCENTRCRAPSAIPITAGMPDTSDGT
jgi:hypothetical protein